MFTAFRVSRLAASICFAVFAALTLLPTTAIAQHDHDTNDADCDHHNDGLLHFSHPLFTESPSPDTKLRLDYLYAGLARGVRDHSVRVEAEYAFSPNVSIEANLPFTSRSAFGTSTSAVGSGEIALKLASFAAARHGLLLGGGIGFGLPTGNDEKGIGSGHIVEVEPYVDLGYKRNALELVSFAAFSTATRRNPDDEEEQEFALALSLLYHLDTRLETLLEMETRRALAGEESGHQAVNAGAGIKYHVPGTRALVLGIGGRVPLTNDREFQREFIVSALYHF